MAKYIIDVPDNIVWLEYYTPESSNNICFHGTAVGINELTPYTEPDEQKIRQKVEQEVWEFAKKVRLEGFDSYSEAKAKYNEWLKQKDEIRVGDECVDEDGDKCVVVCNVDYNMCDVIYDDGSTDEVHKHFLRKTGRHYDYIEKLLEKMQEG